MPATMLSNMVDPEVMAQMVSATLPKRIKFAPIAKIDSTLSGRPGSTITVPKFAYIGDAEDVAEGVAIGTTVLTASTTTATIKKAGKAVEFTDESVLSGYGDPLGEGVSQLTMAIAAKVDNDCYDALCTASMVHDDSTNVIGYTGIVDAVDKLEDESDGATEKILFIHPKQLTQLRKDENFLDINKYPITNGVIMSGMIGSIAGCKVVTSKKVKIDNGAYLNPIVVTDTHDPNEDPSADGVANESAALTIYMKRDVNVETDRDILKKTTVASADEHYTAVLSNESKVVLAKFKV